MAERDVPAALDKVLEVTGQEKLFVIGQSMGATILFSALSEIKRFDDKVIHFDAPIRVCKNQFPLQMRAPLSCPLRFRELTLHRITPKQQTARF